MSFLARLHTLRFLLEVTTVEKDATDIERSCSTFARYMFACMHIYSTETMIFPSNIIAIEYTK